MKRVESENMQANALWFIRMRWAAIIVATALVLMATLWFDFLPPRLIFPLLSIVTGLGILNFGYSYLSKYPEHAARSVTMQMYVDLLALMGMLHFSGGIENPLAIIGLVHVVIAGIIVSRRQSFVVAGVSGGLFGLLAWLELTEIIPHYTFEIFPHDGDEELHAAHDVMYVITRVLLQFVLLFVFCFFVSSITRRLRERESRLREMTIRAIRERLLLEQSLETTGSGLRVIDGDLKEMWSNDRWRSLFACSPASPVRADLDHVARGVIERGSLIASEFVVSGGAKGENAKIVQVTSARIAPDSEGVFLGVQLAQDVTDAHEIQNQMIRAEKLAAVGELSAQISHEINNPVGIISAKARLLRSRRTEEMSGAVASEIDKIIMLADRVAGVAKGFLGFGRPSQQERVLSDVCTIVQDACELVQHKADRNGVDLTVRLSEQCPNLLANRDQLEQVFVNLLLNAIDATERDGTVTVSVSSEMWDAEEKRSVVQLRFVDSGKGIPEGDEQRIFEPFFSTKEKGEGTGLGLSVCKTLIDEHGGSLTIEKTSESGSCFLVQLPVKNPSSGV